ncbi:MAG TPA: ATP-binding protein, partial [Polyangiaceae bacterium]|nr:ATP-binding protein [Polyangiaceae bacterium]
VESEQALKRSLTLLVSCIALATVIGLFLSRKQAVKITRPVQDLTHAAMQLAKGNRTAKVAIDSGDELQQLGLSFNIMVDQLQASYGELQEMNRTLEQRVQERTSELAAKNRDMRLVLDNVNEGFITLSADGVMASERSRVVDEWFGPGVAGDTLWAFWARVSRPFAVEFRLAWEQLKDGTLPLSLCLSQLPDRFSNDGRTWSMTYLPFGTDENFDGMLVVIADITERLAHEREEAAQQELMQSFKRLMLDRSGFTAFLNEGTEMVTKIRSGQWAPDSVEMKRTLHTLKGNTALMGLGFMAKICHNLEDHLEYSGELSPQLLEQLDERWSIIRGHISNFVGDDSQRMVEIPAAEYSMMIAKFSHNSDKQALVHQLLKWQLEPVSRYFDRMAEQARALALRLGKGAITVHLDGGNIRLDGDRWASLFSELTHVVRNAVDHGLEEPVDRKSAGKPRHGTLIFKACTRNDRLVFEIKDDGRGIAWDVVRERAKQLGLPHTTHGDLVDALCYDGLSTRDTATQVSGRGVGMAALKTQVIERHGRIDATSTAGVGTTITLSFPLAHRGDVLVDAPTVTEAPISRAGNG